MTPHDPTIHEDPVHHGPVHHGPVHDEPVHDEPVLESDEQGSDEQGSEEQSPAVRRSKVNMRRLRAGTLDAEPLRTGAVYNRDDLTRAIDHAIGEARRADDLVLVFTVQVNLLPFTRWSKLDAPAQDDLSAAVRGVLNDVDDGIVSVAAQVDRVAGFLTGVQRRSDAEEVANSILRGLEQTMQIRGRSYHFGARIGVSVLDDVLQNGAQLVEASELALAETESSAPYLSYNAHVGRRHDRAVQLRWDLVTAIEEKQIDVVYQPVVSMPAGHLVGLEALVRWVHPSLGELEPQEFLRIAEQTDLIYGLGRLVVTRTLSDAARWSAEGLLGDLTVWVNFAPSEVLHSDFREFMRSRLAMYPDVSLGMDMGEGPAIALKPVSDTIRSLALDDVRAAVDDFGGDFSTLSRLVHLPFDTIKIGSDLVQAVEGSSEDRRIVELATELAHRYDRAVIACGVENERQLTVLKKIGVDAVQGFLLSRPLSTAEVPSVLARARR